MIEQTKEAEEGISLWPLPDTCGAKIRCLLPLSVCLSLSVSVCLPLSRYTHIHWIRYFIVLPLVFLMCISMPDVRKEKYPLRTI
jgi:hypothetical protein